MATLAFIHCADLHLGCKQFRLQARWEDFGAAFARIVTDALARRVDFLLISGDLFHHRNVNAATLSQAVEQLARLRGAGIPVWAIEGNHDRAYYVDGQSWMEYLQTQNLLHMLRPDITAEGIALNAYDGRDGCVAMCAGVRIVGLGYLGAGTRAGIAQAAAQLAEAPWSPYDGRTVVLLHAALDKMGADMAGVPRAGFAPLEVVADYIALGHGHTMQAEGKVYTPGAPEHVHAGEAAAGKGHFVVTLGEQDMSAELVPSAPRAQTLLRVNAARCAQPEELLSLLAGTADRSPPPSGSMVRVIYSGEVPFAAHLLDAQAAEQLILDRYGVLHVEVENALNLLSRANVGGVEMDRALLERQVVREYVAERKPAWAAHADPIAEAVLAMRRNAPGADWAEGALQLARRLREEGAHVD